jgi:hypothetical protein
LRGRTASGVRRFAGPHPDTSATARLYLAHAIWQFGEVERARELIQEAVARAVDSARPATPANTHHFKALFEILRGDAEAARRDAEIVVELSRQQRSDGVVENAAKGRRGTGTQNHCLHGKDAVIEDIVDWRPFDYVTLTALLPIPDAPKILFSYSFEDRSDGGAHFEFRIAKPSRRICPFTSA